MKVIKENISNGKEIYLIENKSMKSVIVWFMYYMPLNESASENAIIPNILLRGSKEYKGSKEMAEFLNDNYGAIIGSDINLKGEIYTLGIHINYINPKLKFVNESIQRDMLGFLRDVLYNPLGSENEFLEEYFEVEKQNLISQIESKKNNKDSYAFDRTIEIMCSGEKYSIDKLGNIDSANKLTNKKVYKRYKEILETAPLKIYVMGDVEMENIKNDIKEIFTFKESNNIEIKIENKIPEGIKDITENEDVNQGKLCIGFRTPINMNSNEFPALSIANRLLGGGPEAMLFTNLREKESLCYTIYSTVEKHKGMLFTVCGINQENKEIAVEKILKTLDDIKNGNFTDNQLKTCISATKHALTSIKDNKYTYIGYMQGLNIYESDYSLEDLIDRLNYVTKEEVINAAASLSLDTIYFLKRGETNEV